MKKVFSSTSKVKIILVGVALLVLPSILFAAGSNPFNAESESSFFKSAYSGLAQIDGDLSLVARLSPSVVRVGDQLNLQLVLTNHADEPIAPNLSIVFPPLLDVESSALPSGSTINLQTQEVTWAPVLNGSGGSAEGIIPLDVIALDPKQYEHKIQIELVHDGTVQQTEVAFWLGDLPSGSFNINPNQASVGQPIQLQAIVETNDVVNQTWMLSDGRQIFAENPEIVF
ncbi:MAG: hypothetical protein AAGD96_26205, partial [Chloroflexota bacterium]